MKKIVLLLALLLAGGAAFGQEARGDMPADVFYLLPEFRQGMVYFSDQGPAQGELNICAVDQTLRFMDKGQELSSKADNINRVVVDDIVFVRIDGVFYRLYPITDDLTVAYRRDVEILRDVKTGAYGIQSRTSAIREVGSLQSDGMMYTLQSSKSYPYNVKESCYLYVAGNVTPVNKRTIRKLFPARKDDLDVWLKNHALPKTLDDTRAFLARLSAGEAL
jgi:hypothetical protein